MALDLLLVSTSPDGVFYYHADNRSVCDDGIACGCSLPTTAQQEAIDRAEARNDWYIIHGGRTGYGTVTLGPYAESKARDRLREVIASGNKRAKLLRVVEDYEP